jgi:ParB/RepB/Spo0J family partition protein
MTDITVDDTNVRHSDRSKDVDLLAESVREHGLLQPVVLMGEWGKPPYRLIVGQRRFLAHRHLNSTHILARFVPPQSKDDASVLSLIENLQRVEVNYADIAAAVTHLWAKCRDDKKVARTLNLPVQTVRDYIRIELYAPAKLKQALKKDPSLKPDVKRALKAAQGDREKAEELFFKVRKMTQYEKRRLVEFGSSHPRASTDTLLAEAKKPKVQETIVLSLDDSLRGALGKAQKALSMDWVDIASTALREWLADKGFLRK